MQIIMFQIIYFAMRCFLIDFIDHLLWKVQNRLRNLNPNNSLIGFQLRKLNPTKGTKGCQS